MNERPILFSAAMIRALLCGTKTQTRRALKHQPHEDWLPAGYGDLHGFDKDGELTDKLVGWGAVNEDGDQGYACPYGRPCDRLWVRETFIAYGRWETQFSAKKTRDEWHFVDMTAECDRCYQYAADHPDVPLAKGRGALPGWYTRPAIFMPRAASRIQLEIVSVRVERLNDCSEADARAEGVIQLDDNCSRPEVRTKDGWNLCPTCAGTGLRSTLGAGGGVNFDVDCADCDTHLKLYRHLWESINGAGSWAANSWVWCLTFRRVAP